jgi:hypothetical protein
LLDKNLKAPKFDQTLDESIPKEKEILGARKQNAKANIL